MASDDLLRLAWEAHHDGRAQLRDGLLTLAVAEGDPDSEWLERARTRLITDRPGHYLAAFPTAVQARANPRVIASGQSLRVKYPPGRVRWLLLQAQAARGTYTGRVESLNAMADDLFGPISEAENVRVDVAQVARGPLAINRAPRAVLSSLAYPASSGWNSPPDEPTEDDDPEDIIRFYLRVLVTVAVLVAMIRETIEQPLS